ncbi:type II toxin-antitoxin system VapB family antitoxin [Methylopila sp. M107]|uniref:type II toxin-antitoxin system VapB family antitoxin n=1 Tax=Methylopila sp. M107 TaxID=1101190 RepID=UPI00036A6DB6|nr:type II toxin-antitoxin system VapB family antitoxin [Methylopila sp. M107]
MPLYIRDDEVADLARRTKEATGAKTVTEAVRVALERALAEAKVKAGVKDQRPLRDRIAEVVARADAMGPSDHSFDMKAFMDDLSGDI